MRKGNLLISNYTLINDLEFNRSVIYLTKDNDEGSIGFVINKKSSTADNGQIAVVLIDNQEATLKIIRKKGKTIALEAANKNYDTKIYAANRIKIQGRLISLYRNFH